MKRLSVMLVILMLCGSIQAGVTVTTDGSTSTYDSLTDVLTTGIPRPSSQFSDSADIGMAQTMTIGEDGFDLQTIHLVYEAASSATVTLHIFEVADVEAATIAVPVGSTLLSETFVAPASGGLDYMAIELDSALTLEANTGYAFYFDTSVDGKVFKWRRTTSTSGSIYSGGVFYDEDAIKNDGLRDAFIALEAVPEPATMALLGMGGLITMLRRKRS